MEKVVLISLVATVVESLPTTKVVDDNISVPLASMVMASFSFGLWLFFVYFPLISLILPLVL